MHAGTLTLDFYRLLTTQVGRQRLAFLGHEHTFRPYTVPIVYSNTHRAELIVHCLRSQFTLIQDVVISRKVDTVNTEVEQFLNTNYDNTLDPATSSGAIS